MPTMLTQAVLFIPRGQSASTWMSICADYCTTQGYQIIAVVHRWEDLVKMLMAGKAEVGVAGHRDHLPRNRKPRLEIVTDKQSRQVPPSQRRPVRKPATP